MEFMKNYQKLAMRTCGITSNDVDVLSEEFSDVKKRGMIVHAITLISSECAEIHELYDKQLCLTKRGVDWYDHRRKEIGDILWGFAELCEALDLDFYDIYKCKNDYDIITKCKCVDSMVGLHMMVGKIAGALQKVYQGHGFNVSDIENYLKCAMTYLEILSGDDFTIIESAQLNIAKLRARYPKGFSAERSLNRAEGDV